MEKQKPSSERVRLISEDGTLTISIKALLSILAGVAFLVASHYQVSNKIHRLESQLALMNAEIESNHNWIKNHNPDEAAKGAYNRLRVLESHVGVLEERLSHAVKKPQ